MTLRKCLGKKLTHSLWRVCWRRVYFFFLLRSDGRLLLLLPLQPRLFLLSLSSSYNCLQLRHLLLLSPPLPQLQTHRQIHTREKQKKKSKLLAINSCLERITHREATSWAPLPWCQNLALTSEEVSKLPFTLCDRSHHDPSNHWIIKKTCVFEPYYKMSNFLLLFSLKGFYDTNSMYKSHVNFKCGNNQILRYNALTEHWQIFLF